jgi:serine/threonine protein kinase KIN1/2
MATATSSAAPTVLRSSSTRAASGNADIPSRHRSNAPRPTSSSHRSSSRTHAHEPPPISNQAALANVARRDHETTNVARRPSSRRSSSQDRPADGGQQYHAEPARSHNREHSRPGSSRNSTDMSVVQTVVANGAVVNNQTPASSVHGERSTSSAHPSTGRRRTSISTTTGTWSLGKTIGQGSMGKVKLGKNTETGEQVSWMEHCRDLKNSCL